MRKRTRSTTTTPSKFTIQNTSRSSTPRTSTTSGTGGTGGTGSSTPGTSRRRATSALSPHPKEKDKVRPFIKKLYTMINEDPDKIIDWDEKGLAFHIRNALEFTDIVLPRYFNNNNISTFTRQLYHYGFSKQNAPGSNGSGTLTFKHPLFQKGRPELLTNIRRKDSQPRHVSYPLTKTSQSHSPYGQPPTVPDDEQARQIAYSLGIFAKQDQDAEQRRMSNLEQHYTLRPRQTTAPQFGPARTQQTKPWEIYRDTAESRGDLASQHLGVYPQSQPTAQQQQILNNYKDQVASAQQTALLWSTAEQLAERARRQLQTNAIMHQLGDNHFNLMQLGAKPAQNRYDTFHGYNETDIDVINTQLAVGTGQIAETPTRRPSFYKASTTWPTQTQSNVYEPVMGASFESPDNSYRSSFTPLLTSDSHVQKQKLTHPQSLADYTDFHIPPYWSPLLSTWSLGDVAMPSSNNTAPVLDNQTSSSAPIEELRAHLRNDKVNQASMHLIQQALAVMT